MNWRYKVLGGHTHVRVFMNGANCGKLCFRNEEFLEIYNKHDRMTDDRPDCPLITFIEDGETQPGEATDVLPISIEPVMDTNEPMPPGTYDVKLMDVRQSGNRYKLVFKRV